MIRKNVKLFRWHDILFIIINQSFKNIPMASKLLWGFTLGLVTGLLLAPEKGSETRKKVSRKAADLKDKFDDFIDSVSERLDSFKNEAEGLAKNAKTEARSFAGDKGGVL
jgi:gas vesicle protein